MRPLQGGILLNGAIRPSISPSHPSPQVQNGSSKKLRILRKFLPGACKGHPQCSVLDFSNRSLQRGSWQLVLIVWLEDFSQRSQLGLYSKTYAWISKWCVGLKTSGYWLNNTMLIHREGLYRVGYSATDTLAISLLISFGSHDTMPFQLPDW